MEISERYFVRNDVVVGSGILTDWAKSIVSFFVDSRPRVRHGASSAGMTRGEGAYQVRGRMREESQRYHREILLPIESGSE